VVFLHRVVPGGADKSYGIHVGQLAGLPQSVVHRAQEVLNELEGGAKAVTKAEKGKHPAKESPPQLSLFGQKSPLLDEIAGLDIDSMTPLEALNKLFELKKKAGEG
jgi:DNA mismatch repair protein MutS